MSSKKYFARRLVLSAMFLSMALLLPFLTGQVPQIGNMLCPMHIPVLLCGFFCGPWYALLIGAVAPLIRFLLFGMPPIMPTGIAMSFELSAYGAIASILYQILPKRKINIYISLLGAMLCGRVVWGIVSTALFGMSGMAFGLKLFLTGAFINSIPGIALQIFVIPLIVISLCKYTR